MNTIVPGPDSGEQKTDKKMRNFSLMFFLEAKRRGYSWSLVMILCSVADPDPGSGPDPGSKPIFLLT
jgi:hypothetical protein